MGLCLGGSGLNQSKNRSDASASDCDKVRGESRGFFCIEMNARVYLSNIIIL
ncbi:hypothetical protein HMP0721_1738 [Pseudoramibacter alactolyticus ATCC 23263]|uniref:Uncharacterized protein n=1 Tax=Pseudoramibacter alactolyticus ATCC 23263 TaxID=887929 RepID=E6MI33_9FIRM|nr:hypothetical protein HMP0721_1738 [Pseudoramibacter alactolyticus ATCC 23263]